MLTVTIRFYPQERKGFGVPDSKYTAQLMHAIDGRRAVRSAKSASTMPAVVPIGAASWGTFRFIVQCGGLHCS